MLYVKSETREFVMLYYVLFFLRADFFFICSKYFNDTFSTTFIIKDGDLILSSEVIRNGKPRINKHRMNNEALLKVPILMVL